MYTLYNTDILQTCKDLTKGVNINTVKLGDNPPPQSFLDDIPWTYGPIKSLGIYFSKNSVEANKLNWDDKIEKLKRILDNWRKRNLTFFGKVTVLKSLALSQVMYTAAVLYTPEWVIKQIRKLSLDFPLEQ